MYQVQQQQHYTLSSPAIATTTDNFNNMQQQNVENLSIESAQLSRDYSMQQMSAEGVVNLPQLALIDIQAPLNYPAGITHDHFVAYKGLYIEQCEVLAI